MRLLAASALLALLLLAPLAGACPTTVATLRHPATGEMYYVGDDGSVWRESNGLLGLQCAMVFGPGGRIHVPDQRVTP